jgi:hypothetical protein
MKENNHRAFIAISLPDVVKQYLLLLQNGEWGQTLISDLILDAMKFFVYVFLWHEHGE